jgi:hypothetical protein
VSERERERERETEREREREQMRERKGERERERKGERERERGKRERERERERGRGERDQTKCCRSTCDSLDQFSDKFPYNRCREVIVRRLLSSLASFDQRLKVSMGAKLQQQTQLAVSVHV